MPTRISAGVGDHPYFLTLYNYDPYRGYAHYTEEEGHDLSAIINN